ncbi:MAG: beta-galactosidase [Patescibacteria group bacterium]|nr:beta-galactosidase [Patescibacteria group bacterium]
MLHFNFFKNLIKFKKIIFLILALLLIYFISWKIDFSKQNQIWGVTFSQPYAENLGLNPKQVYLSILNELNFKKIRLIAYWPKIQPEKDVFNFEDLDFQINQAQKHNKEIILSIGYRVPRWPECHIPDWAKNLSEKDFEKYLFKYLTMLIEKYKNNPNIKIWQVENEYFLDLFGVCPPPNQNLFKKELKLVKNIDPQRPILITDSGELSLWTKTAGQSEIFGTTLYRKVWNQYSGFFTHFFPPSFYTLKSWLVKKLTNTKEVIIIELQAEPWIPNNTYDIKKQKEIFNLNDLKNNINFASKTGISEIYLWGAEWWYLLKINDSPEYWEEIKNLTNRF